MAVYNPYRREWVPGSDPFDPMAIGFIDEASAWAAERLQQPHTTDELQEDPEKFERIHKAGRTHVTSYVAHHLRVAMGFEMGDPEWEWSFDRLFARALGRLEGMRKKD